MAAYADLFNLCTHSDLRNKVFVATMIAAEKIRVLPTPTDAQKAFVRAVFTDPQGMTEKVYWSVVATNAAATIVQITGATDAAIQSAVDSAVTVFVGAI